MGKEPVLAGSGWVGKKDVASPPRIAAAALDEFFDHPAGVLNISPQLAYHFFQGQRNGF
jgi:hypothetical protein